MTYHSPYVTYENNCVSITIDSPRKIDYSIQIPSDNPKRSLVVIDQLRKLIVAKDVKVHVKHHLRAALRQIEADYAEVLASIEERPSTEDFKKKLREAFVDAFHKSRVQYPDESALTDSDVKALSEATIDVLFRFLRS
jgi:hypothetical protein